MKFFFVALMLIIAFTTSVSSQTESNGTNLLLESAKNNDLAGVLLAIKNGEDINTVNDKGWSAAAFAVANGNIEILQTLIQHNIDLNTQENENGYTPLMYAASEGDKELAEVLIQGNADPTIVSSLSEPDRHVTAYLLARDLSRRLVIAAMILEASTIFGMMVNDPALVLASIQEGAYVNIRTSGGWNPLIYASFYGYTDLVDTLISSYNAKINHVENDGWSALHFATIEGHYDVVTVLVNNGIDLSIKTVSNGLTALDIARSEDGYDDIALLLDNIMMEIEAAEAANTESESNKDL